MLRRIFLTFGVIAVILSVVLEIGHAADYGEKYALEKVVILSRHNIRSPLSGSGSGIDEVTPHKWFKWTSAPSELSLRGGQLETIMGQYFRRWLVNENFMTENYLPKSGEMRFYANSKQRTIATARFFAAGMLPMANVSVEHKYNPEDSDTVFSPRLHYMSDAYRVQAMKEIAAMGGEKGLKGIGERLDDSYKVLENILDMKNSPMGRNGVKTFQRDDLEITLKKGKSPSMKGNLKLANSASDALVLQYYEEEDATKAGFGHKLTQKELEAIGKIKVAYDEVLFTAPSVAVNIAHPLLQVMAEEIDAKQRRFTFLCGHDSDIACVLAALEVEDYSLPKTIEKKTPIGSKFVITKWKGKDGQEYAATDLVYQSTEQLKKRTMLSPENPPVAYHLKFKGLERNSDGLYLLNDVKARFQKAIDAFYKLP